VEERGAGMHTNEGEERLAAELVSLREHAADGRVGLEKSRHFPNERCE